MKSIDKSFSIPGGKRIRQTNDPRSPLARMIEHKESVVPLSPWLDVSMTISNALVTWPGDPRVNIETVRDMGKGSPANLSRIRMGLHTGTHVDAPRHFIQDGADVAAMPIDTMVGSARVIEIHDSESIKPGELAQHKIRRGERILFKTANSTRAWKSRSFVEDFVFITQDAADFLVGTSVKMVGIDYLSVGGFHDDGKSIHKSLLAGGVWIIEGLDLSPVKAGKYYLICLPLKIDRGDGAPARAILRPL